MGFLLTILETPRTLVSSSPDASSGGNVEGNGVRSSRRIAGRREGLVAAADGGSGGAGSVPRTFIMRKYGSTLAGLSDAVKNLARDRTFIENTFKLEVFEINMRHRSGLGIVRLRAIT